MKTKMIGLEISVPSSEQTWLGLSETGQAQDFASLNPGYRLNRDSLGYVRGALAPPGIRAHDSPDSQSTVMAGLVPAIHVLPADGN
jgi:hypothetical protein